MQRYKNSIQKVIKYRKTYLSNTNRIFFSNFALLNQCQTLKVTFVSWSQL